MSFGSFFQLGCSPFLRAFSEPIPSGNFKLLFWMVVGDCDFKTALSMPLRYPKLPNGYVVYSIGRDLTDDGGKEPPADPKPDDRRDITFTVERPE